MPTRHCPPFSVVAAADADPSTTRRAMTRPVGRMLFTSTLAWALLAAPLAAATADVDAAMLAQVQQLSPTLVVDRSARTGHVVTLSALSIPTTGVSNEARVRGFLASHPAVARGVSSRLAFTGTSEASGLVVARFVEMKDGLPVEGSELVVTLDAEKRITRIETRLAAVGAVLEPTISDEQAALHAVSRAIGVTLEAPPPYRVVVAARPDGTHVRAVRVIVARPGSFDARAVLVDTASGEVLSSQPATVR